MPNGSVAPGHVLPPFAVPMNGSTSLSGRTTVIITAATAENMSRICSVRRVVVDATLRAAGHRWLAMPSVTGWSIEMWPIYARQTATWQVTDTRETPPETRHDRRHPGPDRRSTAPQHGLAPRPRGTRVHPGAGRIG